MEKYIDLYKLSKQKNFNNKIFVNPDSISFINSEIIFYGHNNILTIENNTKLLNSKIIFSGNNSYLYISSSNHNIAIKADLNNNNNIYIGKNNYFNGILNMIASEEKNIVIGDNCLLSYGITIRTADPHLLYDINSLYRINQSKDVLIGDHVWIGQDVTLLKGSIIHSGSVIGAKSVVTSSKKIRSNEIWAGNPVKKVREGIFWLEDCVHKWTNENTKKFNCIKDNNDDLLFKIDDHTLNTSQISSWIKKIHSYSFHNRFGG